MGGGGRERGDTYIDVKVEVPRNSLLVADSMLVVRRFAGMIADQIDRKVNKSRRERV